MTSSFKKRRVIQRFYFISGPGKPQNCSAMAFSSTTVLLTWQTFSKGNGLQNKRDFSVRVYSVMSCVHACALNLLRVWLFSLVLHSSSLLRSNFLGCHATVTSKKRLLRRLPFKRRRRIYQKNAKVMAALYRSVWCLWLVYFYTRKLASICRIFVGQNSNDLKVGGKIGCVRKN